jgi:hypothetical protein
MNLPVRRAGDVATMAYLKPLGPSPYLTEAVKPNLQLGLIPESKKNSVLAFWRAWWVENEAAVKPH